MVRLMLTASPYEMVSVETAAATIVERAPILTTGQIAPWTAEGRDKEVKPRLRRGFLFCSQ